MREEILAQGEHLSVVQRDHGVGGLAVSCIWGFGRFATSWRWGNTRLRRGRGTTTVTFPGPLALLAHGVYIAIVTRVSDATRQGG